MTFSRFPIHLRKILLLSLIAGSISAAAQSSGQQTGNSTVFKSNSRLVLVDVVVLDNSGRPIEGLAQNDFALTENGHPQQLKVFDPHVANKNTEPAKPFDLPPHQYTNVPETESNSPLTVVLFDTLNTPVPAQVNVRRHMMEFLTSLPPGQRVALFALGSKLRLVQSFSGRSEVLAAAAKNMNSEASPLLSSEVDRQRTEDDLISRERLGAPTINTSLGGSVSAVSQGLGETAAQETERLRDAFAREDAVETNHRAGMTLEALAELAVMLRGYPGRKNLLWISGGFPFSLGPNALIRTEFRDDTRFDQALHGIASLLTTSQVAVYPIDAGGVVTSGISIESNGEGAMGVDGITGVSRTNQLYARQLSERTDTRSTMDEIAEQTGGKAFYGSNDLKAAMQRSVEEGSSYYTLAYTPGDENWNGRFRGIQVKLLRGNYKLQYRRGYYALAEPEHSPNDSTRKLAAALRSDMPNATSLYMKAEILPPDDHGKVRITYLIDPQQITFSDLPGGRKHVLVDLLAVVWDKKGHEVGHAAHTVEATVDQSNYRKLLRSGLQATQFVEAKPDAYRVRIGAIDRASQQVGTIDAVFPVDRAALAK
jgi:VWFA-related protein